MARRQEEEFELVLGNKQLLSVFFIVVVFFAAFFSVGYMVGFNHGAEAPAAPGIARTDSQAAPPSSVRLPEALLREPPKDEVNVSKAAPHLEAPREQPRAPETKREAAADKPSPKPAAQKTVGAAPPAAPAKEQAAPSQTPPERPARNELEPAASAQGGGTSYNLQVAALRVRKDADMLVEKLKAKGYPAAVASVGGDGLHRVVVGPFSSSAAADTFKRRLNDDGFDTFLRKL
jgi:cell division protein FtsN